MLYYASVGLEKYGADDGLNLYATSEFSHADVGLFYLNGSVNKFGSLREVLDYAAESTPTPPTATEDESDE